MKYYLLIPFLILMLINPLSSLLAQQQPSTEQLAKPTEHPEHSSDTVVQHPAAHDDLSFNATREPEDFTSKFLHMLFILSLLVAFMIVASMMLKKMTHARVTQMNDQSLIKVVESRSLSPRSTLYLLNVNGEEILIAESHGGVSHLTTLPKTYKFSPNHPSGKEEVT